MITMTLQEALAAAVARAGTDSGFREVLVTDVAEALRQQGYSLDRTVEVTAVVTETNGIRFRISFDRSPRQLSDAELDGVAGGAAASVEVYEVGFG
jgi:hypothetical protein